MTLKDGSTFNGVPFGLQMGTGRAMIVQFLADGEPAPRFIPADEIVSIV